MSDTHPPRPAPLLPAANLAEWLAALWKFSRPHTIIGTSLSALGLYAVALAAVPVGGAARPDVLLWAWLACLAANIYIVGLNQLTDIAIDRINKPELPLASGRFTPAMGARIILGSVALALLLALTQGRFLLITVAISLLIGTAYSLPPLRLKRFPFWAAASIFTVRGVVVNLLLFLHFQARLNAGAGVPAHIWLLTAFVFGLSLAIAWFKDIPDTEGDARFQIVTLSIRLGRQRVFRLTQGVLALCYGGMVLAGLVGVPRLNGVVLAASHTLLLAVALWFGRDVNVADQPAVRRYYLLIWGLFFAEYLIFPLAVWSA